MAETAYGKISLMMESSPLFNNVPDEITYTMGESGILDSITSWCGIPLHVTQKQADDHPENRSIIGIGVHIPFKLNGKMTPGRLLPVINTIKTVTNKFIAKGLSFNPIFVINYRNDRNPAYPYPVMVVTARPEIFLEDEMVNNEWTARFIQRTLHFFGFYKGFNYINVVNTVTRDPEMRKKMIMSITRNNRPDNVLGNPILLPQDADLSAIRKSMIYCWYETGEKSEVKEQHENSDYMPPEGTKLYLYPILYQKQALMFFIISSYSECDVKKDIGKNVMLREYMFTI